MPPVILPLYGLPPTGAGAEAEQKMLNFLKALPENYYVLRELRTLPSEERRRIGAVEDRPDFVVIGPEIGLVVLEVKDWSIRRNTFNWPNFDQYNIIKIDEFGHEVQIRNPYAQVAEYHHAILELLKSELGQQAVYVHGFVAFPKLTRAEFENTFVRGEGGTRRHVQERFLLDVEQTIFGDMLDRYWDNPLELLKRLARRNRKELYTEAEIVQTVSALIPPKLRVGDLSTNARGYDKLLLMDEQQQKWAFSDQIMGKNYMLEVAGSGKTNILLSRAMHLVNKHFGSPGFRVLVLTYSEPLALDLRRLLDLKIKNQSSPDAPRYKQTIEIRHITELMENILVAYLGAPGAEAWHTQVKSQLSTPDEYLEIKLPEKCQDVLYEQGERFRLYDYLLVDEVQDFSDFFLDVALCLLKKRENVFMVGDIGQKLFDRSHNLSELQLAEDRIRIPASYQMYRSPKYIARLAWSFLRRDPFIAYELQQQGYEEKIKPKNEMMTRPVFKWGATSEELLNTVCEYIAECVANRTRPEQVLCIALPDTLKALHSMLAARAVPVCWANEISTDERKVILAEFTMSKGLEREYVYILDIDRLADGSLNSASMFQTAETLEHEARRSRIKVFVALTRAIREVFLYYTQAHNRFIRELLELQEQGERIR
ncbi:MAG TPA: NERD domain-containing protein [Ktedonobacteraceae bacterium]|nr:NERD domain-containing protein [Ktedonobacteraceae bacterium]